MSTKSIKPVDRNYDPPKNYKEWQDGEYDAVGIEFTSNDENGFPILKQQKNGRVARFNFMFLENGEKVKGPNHGLFLHEFPMLAHAYGTKILGDFPDDTNAAQVTQYLQNAKKTFDASPNTVTVEVKNKWVNGIKGMSIEPGFYNWRIVDVTSKNDVGEKSWFIKQWPKGGQSIFVRVLVEIIAGSQGAPTPYAGCKILVESPYGFEVNDDGDLEWETTDSGEINLNGARASSMYTLTALSMFDEPFNPPDIKNLVPFWLQHMHPSKVLFGKIEANVSSNGYMFYKIDFKDVEESMLTSSQLGVQTAKQQSLPVQQNNSDLQPPTDDELDVKARDQLFLLLGLIAGAPVIVNNIITEQGMETANAHLTPLKDAGKIEGVLLTKTSHNDVLNICKALADAPTLNDDQKGQVRATIETLGLMLVRLDNDSVVQSENTPWG